MIERYIARRRRPSGHAVWHDERVELDGRISIDRRPSGWSVAGELDASTSSTLSAAFAELPATIAQIDVDLGGVTFIDSSGLRVLIALNDRVTGEGGRVVVSSPSNSVRRLLEITGLESTFGVITGDAGSANS
jgi:anti-sigma B factor antagonist